MKKTTKELVEIMKDFVSYDEYLKTNHNEMSQSYMKTDRALIMKLKEKNLSKAEAIAKSGIEVHYAYQIFSGAKSPSRDKVLMLCIGMQMSVEEVRQFLKITGYPQLYGKNERDNVILFGLTKKLSVIDINEILYELNLDILI